MKAGSSKQVRGTPGRSTERVSTARSSMNCRARLDCLTLQQADKCLLNLMFKLSRTYEFGIVKLSIRKGSDLIAFSAFNFYYWFCCDIVFSVLLLYKLK
ncbi:unnamed protein product [Wuchereria bancrofti]|uniref:Uncharacterized protein n=1 Tax=Wuchereria bancrofti TaxID=6293 RepID=A0A3P7DD32_WUCBA|nr:unnamed protein product [Wuchereria bancrofti]